MKPAIYHVQAIGRGSLSVMAKPAGCIPLSEQFLAMAQSGVNRVVCLLECDEAQQLGLVDEQLETEQAGMEFVSYPIQDMSLPVSVHDYLNFTKRLVDEAEDGIHTVVHCRAGIGRTGMIAAGMLLHCGYNALNALEHISTKRGVNVPDTKAQTQWVIECEVVLRKNRYLT